MNYRQKKLRRKHMLRAIGRIVKPILVTVGMFGLAYIMWMIVLRSY